MPTYVEINLDMPDYKAGDTIKCVVNGGYEGKLEIGGLYTVRDVYPNRVGNSGVRVCIEGTEHCQQSYHINRFVKVEGNKPDWSIK